MPDRLFVLVCCILLLLSSSESFSQKPPQPSEDGAASAESEQPEPPKQVLVVEVSNGLLSLELANVEFGQAIKAIAEKADFSVEGSGDVFRKKLTTKFSGLDVERGITRLLTLVKESNYMLHYDSKGAVSSLEIFGSGAVSPAVGGVKQPPRPQTLTRPPAVPPAAPQPARPAAPAATSPVRPAARPAPPLLRRPAVPARPAVQPIKPVQPQAADEADEDDDEDEEEVIEVPYVPPRPTPMPPASKKP